MPLINRIEIANFMNSRREQPWRPDWTFQQFDLKGENTAINMPNGRGKSTVVLAVLAMLTADRSINEIRSKHFAAHTSGHYSHVRIETYIWADDESPNDLVAQAGGDFGGYPMVFGIYGKAGENGGYKLYTYRGTFEDCPIGRREGNRVMLTANADFLDKLSVIPSKFPAAARDDTRANWRNHVGSVFDMPSIEQQLVYQKAKGAEGSSGYFDVNQPRGRTYAETVFYERLAPELLVDMMGNVEEYAVERGIEDIIHKKVQGIIKAKAQTTKTAEELERTRHVLEELERIREKADGVTTAKADTDTKITEFSLHLALLKDLVVDAPIPGIPRTPPEDAPILTRVMVMQRGKWCLPDRAFVVFTGEQPMHVNERANSNRINFANTDKSQLIDLIGDIKLRDERGKPNKFYDAAAVIALLNVTTNFKNGYFRETAIRAVEDAFAWAEVNGDTNPARLEKRDLEGRLGVAKAYRKEVADRRDALHGENGKLVEEQQQIGAQQAEFRRMAESGLFSDEDLISPAETGRKIEENHQKAERSLAEHRRQFAENKAIFEEWQKFVTEHGEDANPAAIATLLESRRDEAKQTLDDNRRDLEAARKQTNEDKADAEAKGKRYAALAEKSTKVQALRSQTKEFAERFGDENPDGLERTVRGDLKCAEKRRDDIGLERARMNVALAAWQTFIGRYGDSCSPKDWLGTRDAERIALTGEIATLGTEIKNLKAQRADLDKAAVAPGIVAREVLELAGADAEPLHAVVERMVLAPDSKERVLSLFSALLFAPVYGTAERAAEAACLFAANGIEAPVFLAEELKAFCRDTTIAYDGTVARMWLVGVRTRPVDCLLDPSLVPREKEALDGSIAATGGRLAAKEGRFVELDPESEETLFVRKAKEAVDNGYPAKDGLLVEELADIGKDMQRLLDRASDDALASIRAVIEYRLLLTGETEETLAEALVTAEEVARVANDKLAVHKERVGNLEAVREQLQAALTEASVAVTNAPILKKISNFVDGGGPAFMQGAPAAERTLDEAKQRAEGRKGFRFDLAETFVKSGERRSQEIEKRLRSIEGELKDIIDVRLPDIDRECETLGNHLPGLEGDIVDIDNLVWEVRKKYREMARTDCVTCPVPRERLASHPLAKATVSVRRAEGTSEIVAALRLLREPLEDIEATTLAHDVVNARKSLRLAHESLCGEIDRVKSADNIALNEQMRIGLDRAKEDIDELVRMITTTRDNFDKSRVANETARHYLDDAWEGIGSWLENFTRRLPGNFEAMRTAFRPARDSVSGDIATAGFEIEAKIADMNDVRTVLTNIVNTVEKRDRSREALGDDENERAHHDRDMLKKIREEFYRSVLIDPKIRICIPSISRRPLTLEKNMVSSGQGVAMTLLWIIKMADYVTERELRRQNVSNAQRRKVRSQRTQFVIIDGAFSHLSDRKLITDALDGVRRTRGKFQLIITGHDPNYRNDYAYFPTYISAREIGGNLMYADCETRRALSPEEVGSRNGVMELASWHKRAENTV